MGGKTGESPTKKFSPSKPKGVSGEHKFQGENTNQ